MDTPCHAPRRKLKRVLKKVDKKNSSNLLLLSQKKLKVAINTSLNSTYSVRSLRKNNYSLVMSLQNMKQELKGLRDERNFLLEENYQLREKMISLENMLGDTERYIEDESERKFQAYVEKQKDVIKSLNCHMSNFCIDLEQLAHMCFSRKSSSPEMSSPPGAIGLSPAVESKRQSALDFSGCIEDDVCTELTSLTGKNFIRHDMSVVMEQSTIDFNTLGCAEMENTDKRMQSESLLPRRVRRSVNCRQKSEEVEPTEHFENLNEERECQQNEIDSIAIEDPGITDVMDAGITDMEDPGILCVSPQSDHLVTRQSEKKKVSSNIGSRKKPANLAKPNLSGNKDLHIANEFALINAYQQMKQRIDTTQQCISPEMGGVAAEDERTIHVTADMELTMPVDATILTSTTYGNDNNNENLETFRKSLTSARSRRRTRVLSESLDELSYQIPEDFVPGAVTTRKLKSGQSKFSAGRKDSEGSMNEIDTLSKARSRSRSKKRIAESSDEQSYQIPEDLVPDAVTMRKLKSGQFKFAVGRKDSEGSRKEIDTKARSRSRSKKRIAELIEQLPQEEPKSIFDFHDKTPTFGGQKNCEALSIYSLADESITSPSVPLRNNKTNKCSSDNVARAETEKTCTKSKSSLLSEEPSNSDYFKEDDKSQKKTERSRRSRFRKSEKIEDSFAPTAKLLDDTITYNHLPNLDDLKDSPINTQKQSNRVSRSRSRRLTKNSKRSLSLNEDVFSLNSDHLLSEEAPTGKFTLLGDGITYSEPLKGSPVKTPKITKRTSRSQSRGLTRSAGRSLKDSNQDEMSSNRTRSVGRRRKISVSEEKLTSAISSASTEEMDEEITSIVTNADVENNNQCNDLAPNAPDVTNESAGVDIAERNTAVCVQTKDAKRGRSRSTRVRKREDITKGNDEENMKTESEQVDECDINPSSVHEIREEITSIVTNADVENNNLCNDLAPNAPDVTNESTEVDIGERDTALCVQTKDAKRGSSRSTRVRKREDITKGNDEENTKTESEQVDECDINPSSVHDPEKEDIANCQESEKELVKVTKGKSKLRKLDKQKIDSHSAVDAGETMDSEIPKQSELQKCYEPASKKREKPSRTKVHKEKDREPDVNNDQLPVEEQDSPVDGSNQDTAIRKGSKDSDKGCEQSNETVAVSSQKKFRKRKCQKETEASPKKIIKDHHDSISSANAALNDSHQESTKMNGLNKDVSPPRLAPARDNSPRSKDRHEPTQGSPQTCNESKSPVPPTSCKKEISKDQDSSVRDKGMKKKNKSSSSNIKQDLSSSLDDFKDLWQVKPERQRRTKAAVSYAEPSVNKKLRRGDPFTSIAHGHGVKLKIYKSPKLQGSKKTSNRTVLNSLQNLPVEDIME